MIAVAALLMATGTAHSATKRPVTAPKALPATPATALQSALGSARADFRRATTDRFASSTVASNLEGQPFRIEATFMDGESTGVSARSGLWTYEKGKLKFILTLDNSPGYYTEKRDKVLKFAARMANGQSYIGETGLGVKRRVTVQHWGTDAIGFVQWPAADEASPYEDLIPRPKSLTPIVLPPEDRAFWVEVPAAGEAARTLTKSVKFVIEGQLTKLPSGDFARCKADFSDAEVDHPTETTEVMCWVGGNVTRVAFIDTATGTVLKEWTGQNGMARAEK